MQVVFGGLSVTIAIVALVIGYFAWINPQSTNDDARETHSALPTTATATDATTVSTSPTTQHTADGVKVALASLTPSVGGVNIRANGSDLAMPCASGAANDRQRTVEYDLAGRYANFAATLTVSNALDPDTKLQMKIFTDERQAADVVLAKKKSARTNVPLHGKRSLKIQLICEAPDSEMTIGVPLLTHV
jgi:hypothetical protein